jgi:hypothetical protein
MGNPIRFLLLLVGINIMATDLVLADGEYYVYSDKFDNGTPSGIMGVTNGSSLQINPDCKENPLKGENCLKILASGQEAWSGVYIQKGAGWKGSVDSLNPLADLRDKKYFIFSIRSDVESQKVGIGMGEGGNEAKKSESGLVATTKWQRYVMELPTKGLHRVNGLLMVVFEGAGTIYLDEVFYAGADFQTAATDIVYKERTEPLDPTSFYIYSDKFDHGIASGYCGEKNGSSLKLDENNRVNPYMGPKCIKITTDKSETWRGLYIFSTGKWTEQMGPNDKFLDLSDYDKLEFYARSDSKSSDPYIIGEIGIGAGGGNEEKRSETIMEIGNTWKKYTISLKGMELKKINTLIFFILPVGTLYMDEIRFIKKKAK